MSNTILELIRHKFEEVEQYEKALSKTFGYKEHNPKETIVAETIIKRCLDKIQENSREILDLFEDKNGIFKQEKQIMTGNIDYLSTNLCLLKSNTNTYSNLLNKKRKPDIWINFYDKIKEIKLLNKSGNDINHSITGDKIFNNLLSEINSKHLFTSEENNGKCLDLHEFYHQYINIPGISNDNTINIDYLQYLNNFDSFHNIKDNIKKGKEYQNYIKNLTKYLKDFFKRTQPLVNFDEIQDIIDTKFEEEYNNNNDNNSNKEENNKLYCEVCKKSFAKETLMTAHLASKKHLKKLNNQNIQNADNNKNDDELLREISYYEYQIIRYKDLLISIVNNTLVQIRKKQTMNLEELESDRLNSKNNKKVDPFAEDNKKVFNPKNIPIGWDGKPIPYWLYKIHGLGIEFKCEICGGASYWGRRAFEHHFQEWRHAYGMKCLKLPNTLQFKNLTKIEDALKLHHKLIEDKNNNEFNPDTEEQFEDEKGNVYSKKMMTDLEKQGLINKDKNK